MKIALYISSFFVFISCQYFEKQLPSENELVDKEVKTINWNTVDEYPTFATCDSIADKNENQRCFISELSRIVQQKLDENQINLPISQTDTLGVLVIISPNATIEFETKENLKIDTYLKEKLVDFPLLKPATKRGIPVRTQFVLPVILKVK